MTKYEWRKQDRALYLPKAEPTPLHVPTFNYYTIAGHGDPNAADFGERTAALYQAAYGIRMMPKSGLTPAGYYEYTVFPLEGLWTLDPANVRADGNFDKADLDYQLMLRQPDFVTPALAAENIARVQAKKAEPLLMAVKFEALTDGDCLQILHRGSYDDEPATFQRLADYAADRQWERRTLAHKEIYLSDPRRTVAAKRQTVLRWLMTPPKA
ncbi:GyrI-like domain-containing protein [Lactiplantibacillus sp. WILCCON 0030]|uniref:GyrI-like domain-containing protein n=1 Tax=Lactiplantibacillus brownii TaxID=3069269 RepID=A0ABU1A5E1_9LACO|nr:GyrI-like domain-containing protein [Lactiplantibacillus brownii]MDQ7936209.1 GyrI-like domain-containing protein [Lactiplantibacillus brownii]